MRRAVYGVIALALLAGCGTSSHAAVRPSCQSGAVTLRVGSTLDVSKCGSAASAAIASGTALRSLGPLEFLGEAAGSAVVTVTSGPTCTAGNACSQLRVVRATLHVTVQ